jgi:dolichol-phosphate mannosyltransferase
VLKHGSKIDHNFGIAILNLGFKRGEIEFLREKREQGLSSYTFTKKIKLALETLFTNVERVLYLLVIVSIISSFLCVLGTILLVTFRAFGAFFLPGWLSIISISLLLFSLLFLVVSVIAILTLKIFKYLDNPVSYSLDEETL